MISNTDNQNSKYIQKYVEYLLISFILYKICITQILLQNDLKKELLQITKDIYKFQPNTQPF